MLITVVAEAIVPFGGEASLMSAQSAVSRDGQAKAWCLFAPCYILTCLEKVRAEVRVRAVDSTPPQERNKRNNNRQFLFHPIGSLIRP